MKDAQCIRQDIIELSLEGFCTDPKKLPYLILHKIVSNDIRCRTNLFKKEKKGTAESHENDDSEDSSGSEDESDIVNPDQLHPVDCLLALLLCCDDILRRDIFSRLAKCQIAIPLVLPDPFSNHLIIPLWAMRSIYKEWDMLEGKPQLCRHIVSHPMPIVSIIRFGRHQSMGLSKSQILNVLIDGEDNNSHFFHRDCSGGNYKQILGKGLVDMCWYLPSDHKSNDNAVTFLNLHGDANKFPRQVKFLTQISSICLLMVCKKDVKCTKEIKDILYSSSAELIVLNATSKKSKDIDELFPNSNIIKVKSRSAPVVNEEVWMHMKAKLSEIKKIDSIENVSQKACDSILSCDEHTSVHQAGSRHAMDIIQSIKAEKKIIKEDILPLQGKLWRNWSFWNKELNRQDNRGLKTIDEYSHIIECEKEVIRRKQLQKIKNMSPVMALFIDSLFNTMGQEKYLLRTYFLQNLILELDKLSMTVYNEKEKIYKELRDSKDKKTLIEEVLESSFGLEHLLREVGQIYEASSSCEHDSKYCSQLSMAVAQLLIEGYPLELMDGDATHVPIKWVKAVLEQAVQLLESDQKVYVLSVLGLQSTGKSTMLNTTFGLQFKVSAGRCTRGAFMQLLPFDSRLKSITGCSYVLIVDTEGLRAVELEGTQKQRQEHDNELATFVIGLANMTIVNIYGEAPGDLDDILQTSVHAFLRMNKVKIDASCHFVHQNASPNTKTDIGKKKFTAKLNEFTVNAAKEEKCEDEYKCFNDIIKYDDTTNVHYFKGLWKGDPPMAPINPGYSATAQSMKLNFVQAVCKSSQIQNMLTGLTITSFGKIVSSLWEALLKENFVLGFRNTREISSYNALEIEYTKLTRKFKNAMMEWEDMTGNEIDSADLNSLSKLKSDKMRDLSTTIEKHFDEAQKNLEKYFESNDDVLRWKISFMSKLDSQKYKSFTHAQKHLNRLINAREALSSFEARKNEIIADIKQNVRRSIDAIKEEQKELSKNLEKKKLSKCQIKKLLKEELFTDEKMKVYRINGIREAALHEIIKYKHIKDDTLTHILYYVLSLEEVNKILKQLSKSHEAIEEGFNQLWKDLISKIPEYHSFTKEEIAHDVESALMSYVGKQGSNTKIIEMLQKKALEKYNPELYSGRDRYQWISRVKKWFYVDNTDEISNDILFQSKQYSNQLTARKSNFTPTLVDELLQFTDDKILEKAKQYASTQSFSQKHEIYVTVCACALPRFEKMAKSFASRNDPRSYINKYERGPLLTQYKNQYQQMETEEAVASTLCAYLEERIKYQVNKNLPTIILRKMPSANHQLSNKQALKVKILMDLLEKDDFDSYMVYVKNIKKCLLDHIIMYMIQYCDQNVSNGDITELQKAAIQEVIRVTQIVRSIMLKPNLQSITLEQWLLLVCNDPEFRKIGVKLVSRDLIGNYDCSLRLDLNNFYRIITDQIQELENRITSSFRGIASKSKVNQWNSKIEEQFKDLIGCCSQCPFCGEQCDLMEHDVRIQHKTEVHRADCIQGWRTCSSEIMHPDFCPILVSSDGSFYKYEEDTESVKYKCYTEAYPDWSIPPNMTSQSTLYWKWFVNKYKCQIIEFYSVRDLHVPAHWKTITKQAVKKDLFTVYHVNV